LGEIMKLRISNIILISFVFSTAFLISGCYKPDDKFVTIPVPDVTATPPKVNQQSKPPVTITSPIPAGWYQNNSSHKWSAIIIHHSATATGNMASFNEEHIKRGWNGVGYDFVIDNGTYNSPDGQIEVTFRWKQQLTGAHTGETPNNWANEEGIGICLVGDFDQRPPTAKQMQSLAKLVKFLQTRYNIPSSRIYGHGTTPGGHPTDCPGKRFSMYQLKSML
jgi:hypothetical protein